MMNFRERFIETDPATLQWSSEPINDDEGKRAEDLFTWIDMN